MFFSKISSLINKKRTQMETKTALPINYPFHQYIVIGARFDELGVIESINPETQNICFDSGKVVPRQELICTLLDSVSFNLIEDCLKSDDVVVIRAAHNYLARLVFFGKVPKRFASLNFLGKSETKIFQDTLNLRNQLERKLIELSDTVKKHKKQI